MKLTFILLIAFYTVQARGIAQGKVTLTAKNASLDSILKEIAKQAGLGFTYTTDVTITIAKKVDISVKEASVTDALNICFKNQPFTYDIINNTIVVKNRQSVQTAAASVQGPGKMVRARGIVYNEAGQPLSAANVTIKESGKGTITNAKGEYDFMVPFGSSLVISFIGYAPEKVDVPENQIVQVYLTVAKNELDKVVIQAYGTTTQRLATGNITTVTAAEIEKQPVMNALQAIEGKVPGLVITQTSGYSSAPFKVEIRGRSIVDPSHASEPLYIIDGVPLTVLDVTGNGSNYAQGSMGFIQNGLQGPAQGQSPLFSINPNDIETVTVLKDADATAIYGSRGANGVIIITTKRGKPGKTRLELNFYNGGSTVTNHYTMLNTQQYLSMRHEAFANDGITPDAGNAYDLLAWDTTRYTDWQKFLWGKTGRTTDLEASLSGGDKQTTFIVAGAYHNQTSILSASGADQRVSVQFNLNHKSLNQKLNASFTSNYSYTFSDLIGLPGSSTFSPNAPAPFDANGNLNWDAWQPLPVPFVTLLQPYNSKTGFLNSRLFIQYELFDGLHISSSFGYSTMHNSQSYLTPIVSQNPLYNPLGQSDFGNNNLSNAILEPQIEYKKRIKRSILNTIVGATLQTVTQDGSHDVGSGYINDNLLHSISNAPTKNAIDNMGQYKYSALFARINYNIDNKYIFNVSARRDGSSRFGPGRQFGNFGALGAAYIFTEENWFKKHATFLSFGKIRGSYGITGSDNIGDYNFLTQWANSNTTYVSGLPSYVPLRHSNPDLEWQVNKKIELALDMGFLKDKISIELAFYRNRCGNQLVSMPLPTITGFNTVTGNLPATIQNHGFESIINLKLIDKKEIEWSANFDIGFNRNKLIAFPNLAQSTYASAFEVGKSLNIVKLLHYTGIDSQTGQYTFEDVNHDGQIDYNSSDSANDLSTKDLSVKFDGGFGTNFRYKGWQISLFFHFRKQTLRSNMSTMGYPGLANNFSTEILNRWQKPGDNALFARYTTQPQTSDFEFYTYSDGVFSDGSYIRLQNLSISYDLPGKLAKKLGLENLTIFGRGQNLFIITKYKGLDPDVPFFGAMPTSKIFTGGIKLNL